MTMTLARRTLRRLSSSARHGSRAGVRGLRINPADIVPAFVCVRARATTRETRIKTRRARDRFSTDSRLTTTDDALARSRAQISRGDLHRVRGVDVDRVLRVATVDDDAATVGRDGVGKKLAPTFDAARGGGDANGKSDDESAGAARGESGAVDAVVGGVVDVSRGDQTDHVRWEIVVVVSVRGVDEDAGDGARAGTAKTRGGRGVDGWEVDGCRRAMIVR